MAKQQPATPYSAEQRQLFVHVYLTRDGETRYKVIWRWCEPGDTSLHEAVLFDGRWQVALANPSQALKALERLGAMASTIWEQRFSEG